MMPPGITKLADGTFLVKFRFRDKVTRMPMTRSRKLTANGKPITSRAEAMRIREELIREVERELSIKESPLWKDVIAECIESYILDQTWQSDTAYDYKTTVECYTLPQWEKLRVKDISPHMILNLFQGEVSAKSIGTRIKLKKILNRIFEYSREKSYIPANPMPGLRFRKDFKLKPYIKEEDVIRLLKTTEAQGWEWYPIVAMGIFTGIRSGELYAMKWDSIDLERRLIKVHKSWSRRSGLKNTTKGHADRLVVISSDLAPLLQELRRKNPEADFVLPRVKSWGNGEQAKQLKRKLRELKIPEVNFRDLRATWTTLLRNHGANDAQIQKMGGWRRSETMDIYNRSAGIDITGSMDGFCILSKRVPRYPSGPLTIAESEPPTTD